MSGRGWLFLPEYKEETCDVIMEELSKYASEINVHFNRSQSQLFMKNVKMAKKWLTNVFGIQLEPVTSHSRGFISMNPSKCKDVQLCCTNNTRYITYHGSTTCDMAKKWYQDSNCCKENNNTLKASDNWPSYLHAKNMFDGAVQFGNSKKSRAYANKSRG
jgi:hypothetical protein